MYFQYDTSGLPLGFILNGVQYFYVTNIVGDVIGITDANGNALAEYAYDEWGKVLDILTVDSEDEDSLNLAKLNPIRYRGYYYDNETDYYYLQSRYYDPNLCRFINADIPEIAQLSNGMPTGTNLFAYCNNNPINNSDPLGTIAFRIKITIFSAILAGIVTLICDLISIRLKVQSNLSSVGTYVSTMLKAGADAFFNKGLLFKIGLTAISSLISQFIDFLITKNGSSFTKVLGNVCKSIVSCIIDYVCSKLLFGVLKYKSPQYIRDIKKEANAIGIKGTTKLTEYLKVKQQEYRLVSMTYSKMIPVLKTVLKGSYSRIKGVVSL